MNRPHIHLWAQGVATLLFAPFLIPALAACGPAAPPPTLTPEVTFDPAALASNATPAPGERVLAMTVIPPIIPPPAEVDAQAAYDLAESIGVRGEVRLFTWAQLEPTPGIYALDEFAAAMEESGNQRGFTLLINLAVINTTRRELPPDLANTPFDSADMKARFHALIDALLPYLNENVRYLSIGNEVDVYLHQHRDEWLTYQDFYDDAGAYLNEVAPEVQVGLTTSLYGMANVEPWNIVNLNSTSDVMIYTYHPVNEDYTVQEPDAPITDFRLMVALAQQQNMPLILQEVGYPSAGRLGSSEEQQAEFVRSVFEAWDNAGGGNIPFLSFANLHDWTDTQCGDLAGYYGLARDLNFEAYLCSLGLRRANGLPKAAWDALIEGARSLP